MRSGILALVGVVVAMAEPRDARACSCETPAPPLDSLATAAAVFEGQVLSDTQGNGSASYGRTLKLCVSRAWKGVAAGSVVSVDTGSNGADCGYENNLKGMTLLVYAAGDSSRLTTGICNRTQAVAAAAEDLTALGSPTSVVDGGAPTCVTGGGGGCVIAIEPAGRSGRFGHPWWFVGLGTVGALVGLAARRSRRGRATSRRKLEQR